MKCPTCGRYRRGASLVDPMEVRRLAERGYAVNRAAQLLGVHRATLVRVAQELGITFKLRRGSYVPQDCARVGERNGRAKITRLTARRIFLAPKAVTTADLAERYGLSTVQINKIRRGASWVRN